MRPLERLLAARRPQRLAFGWVGLVLLLFPALLFAGAEGAESGALIKRVQLTSESQRPSAIAFDSGGDLKIVMAPFGDLWTRDGKTLMPKRGIMHRAGSPPISPVSLVAAPNGTVYAAGYMQQVARSRLGHEGHSGPMEPWLGRAELGNVAPIALAIDNSGDLFAADLGDGMTGNQGVVRIDRETGAMEVRVPTGGSGLQSARALAFDGLNKLYVADMRAGAVLRFRRDSGELDRVIVQPSGDGESEFIDLAVGANGKLYVLDSGRGEVLRFTIDVPGAGEVLIDLSAETSHKAMSMAVSPSGDIAVLTDGAELLLYAGDDPGAAPGLWPVTARAEPRPALAPRAAAARPATVTRRRLHLRVDRSTARGYRQADRGVLLREIYRQGLALAAIHEVGALLRDQGLGEAAAADALELVASVLVLPGKTLRLGLADPASPTVPLWSRDLPVGDGKRVDYLEAVAEVERLARERWPAVLRELGLEGVADPPGAVAARETGEVTPPAGELDVLTQLLRVRAAHRRLGADADESLGELALGYANLAFVTAFQWSEANESLRARSLLYAERLAVAHPSPRALRVRAYARALAGFHAAALRDLEAAGAAPATFDWQEAIEAYCRADFPSLTRLAAGGGEGAELAGRLAFRVIADSGSNVLLRRTSQAVLGRNPHAWEVYAGLGLAEDFGLEGRGASALKRNLEQLGVRLSATPGLPTSASPEDQPGAMAEMLESLNQWWGDVSRVPGAMPSVSVEIARQLEALSEAAAGDDGQPSWQALSHLLGETLFAQVERFVGFEGFSRAVEIDVFLELLRPFWRAHPLAGLIEIYALDPQLDRERLDSLVSGLELAQPRPELEHLRRQLLGAGDESATATIWKKLGIERSALDETADDLARLLVHSHDAGAARRLQRVSPESPAALAMLITKDWPSVEERAARWRAEPVHPQIARELAARYRRGQELEDAVTVLERYVEEVPDTWAYNELASVHGELGNAGAWVRTLEDYLAVTDQHTLAEDRVRERLAWHYNERGEFSKARPYADRAAASWASWGLQVAAWTYEGLGDWKRAETLRRSVSQRYDSVSTHWYFWCRRTGRGNLDAARWLAESVLPDRRAAGGDAPMEVGYFQLLEGDLEAAEREFRTVFEDTGNPLAGLHLAFLLFDLERPEAAGVLAQVSDRGSAYVGRKYVLGEMLEITAASRRLLAGELTVESHRAIVDRILATVDERYRVNADYFLGRFLERAGYEAEARELFERCAEAWHLGMWNSTLAAVRLRELD